MMMSFRKAWDEATIEVDADMHAMQEMVEDRLVFKSDKKSVRLCQLYMYLVWPHLPPPSLLAPVLHAGEAWPASWSSLQKHASWPS